MGRAMIWPPGGAHASELQALFTAWLARVMNNRSTGSDLGVNPGTGKSLIGKAYPRFFRPAEPAVCLPEIPRGDLARHRGPDCAALARRAARDTVDRRDGHFPRGLQAAYRRRRMMGFSAV